MGKKNRNATKGRLGAILSLLLLASALLYWWYQSWLEHSQDVPIRVAAEHYGVDPALVKAVVWKESRFHPGARGKAGEIGLMQLREDAAREWADAEIIRTFDHEHCHDPQTNT